MESGGGLSRSVEVCRGLSRSVEVSCRVACRVPVEFPVELSRPGLKFSGAGPELLPFYEQSRQEATPELLFRFMPFSPARRVRPELVAPQRLHAIWLHNMAFNLLDF